MNTASHVKKADKGPDMISLREIFNKHHKNVVRNRMKPELSRFKKACETIPLGLSLNDIRKDESEKLALVGVDLTNEEKAGRYLLYGADEFTALSAEKGVEIMPVSQAFYLYPDIRKNCFFNSADRNDDDYSSLACNENESGYFIRVRKNVRLKKPVHAGLFMHSEKSTMCVHNIVILEEGAVLHLITGCTSADKISEGLHIAVSEHYLGKKAMFTNTMIHNWGTDFVVHPSTVTYAEDDAAYVSNYYCLHPPGFIESNPFTWLCGKSSSAKYMTVLASMPDTYCDIGGTVLMSGEDSGAELVARAVCQGGTVIQTGLLTGAAPQTRGHVDCSGLMLDNKGVIEAVPGLRSLHPDARLSHEAAIGRIDTGEVNYLMSKGLEEMQAVALIIRGFLDIGIESEALDKGLEEIISQIAGLSGHGD